MLLAICLERNKLLCLFMPFKTEYVVAIPDAVASLADRSEAKQLSLLANLDACQPVKDNVKRLHQMRIILLRQEDRQRELYHDFAAAMTTEDDLVETRSIELNEALTRVKSAADRYCE